MNTRYIHLNSDIHQFIRIDHPAGGGESILSATNIPLSKLPELIAALQKIEQEPEHPIMTAALGSKPDSTDWYARALRAEAEKPIKAAPNFKNSITGWTPDNPIHQPSKPNLNIPVPKSHSEPAPALPQPKRGKGILNVIGVKTRTHKRNGKAVYGGTSKENENADICKGQWIRIYGLSDWRVRYEGDQRIEYQKAFDKTFKIGDTCEYGSYNFIYTGIIVSIGEKSVTVEHGGSRTRLDLHAFIWRNWDYDADEIAKHNAIESQVQ